MLPITLQEQHLDFLQKHRASVFVSFILRKASINGTKCKIELGSNNRHYLILQEKSIIAEMNLYRGIRQQCFEVDSQYHFAPKNLFVFHFFILIALFNKFEIVV